MHTALADDGIGLIRELDDIVSTEIEHCVDILVVVALDIGIQECVEVLPRVARVF